MTREEILATLRAHEPPLRSHGVRHAALFGSHARCDTAPESDVDIMVELDPAAAMTLWDYVGLKDAVQALFPGRVDVISRSALSPYIRENVERDAVYAF